VGDQAGTLAGLLMDAEPRAFAALFLAAAKMGEPIATLFREKLREGLKQEGTGATEDQKDRLAEQQARAAVALVRMGHGDEIWPLLRHSADPRLRSFIVNWLCPLGADPRAIAVELDRLPSVVGLSPSRGQLLMDAVLFDRQTSQRRALILALGTYGAYGLSQEEREPLTGRLTEAYCNDPDAGVHGAAAWTLRKWGQGERIRSADIELSKLHERGGRRWFINKLGQTLVVIDGPVEFSMGSAQSETGRDPSETLHRPEISHRYAIASAEVTVEQYERFVEENPGADHAVSDRYSPDSKGPMNHVSWYHAAAYCNWLSRREGLAACYDRAERGPKPNEMRIRPDALRRTGYRLPTEAEWEFACRAGSDTTRPYGASQDLLGRYAWYIASSQDRAWPCASLQPNDLGLFDMLGNVFEWCQGTHLPDSSQAGALVTDDPDRSGSVDQEAPRSLRGGSFPDRPAYIRSAARLGKEPRSQVNNAGFRVARTLP
jgi:formylglycine-generating enzyme required for sulfatase activity